MSPTFLVPPGLNFVANVVKSFAEWFKYNYIPLYRLNVIRAMLKEPSVRGDFGIFTDFVPLTNATMTTFTLQSGQIRLYSIHIQLCRSIDVSGYKIEPRRTKESW